MDTKNCYFCFFIFNYMNISYSWLKQYIDINLSPAEVAKVLTSIGLEVEAIESVEKIKGGLGGICDR